MFITSLILAFPSPSRQRSPPQRPPNMPPPFHAEQIRSLLHPESFHEAYSEAAAAQASPITNFYSTIKAKAMQDVGKKAINWVIEQ
jgi:hypothetical protein